MRELRLQWVIVAIFYGSTVSFAQSHLPIPLPMIEHVLVTAEHRLRNDVLRFSVAQRARFLARLRKNDQAIYELLRERPAEDEIRLLALRTALLHKNRSVDELADISRTIYQNLASIERRDYRQLRTIYGQLSELTTRNGISKFFTRAHQARIRRLQRQADVLEAKLASESEFFRSQRQLPLPVQVVPQVTASLPPDSALIEIVAFDSSPLVPASLSHSPISNTPVYIALILLPSGEIRYADLGPAISIDRAIADLQQALSISTSNSLPAAQILYRLVFAPIAPLLDTRRHIYLSPDGQLNLIPFDALHDGARSLIDTYEFTYLTSGRELLRHHQDIQPSNSVAVFAPFVPMGTPLTPALPASTTPTPPSLERSPRVAGRIESFRAELKFDISWDYLPYSLSEAMMVQRLFPQTRLWLAQDATHDAFLNASAPGILEVATHGFVFADDDVRVTSVTNQPLLHTGIWMVERQSADIPPASQPSALKPAVVTALEISEMNLWGTQLVVLSACSTGRGIIKDDHGLFGLRRAFVIAGAETVVSSLWDVDDRTTQMLMEAYYTNLLAGHGRARAMHMAAQTLRATHPHPYYWAPFIVSGNGAPLRGFGGNHDAAH